MVAVAVTVLAPVRRVTPVQVKMWSLLVFAPSDVPLSVSVTVAAFEYTLTAVDAVVRWVHRRLVMYSVGAVDQSMVVAQRDVADRTDCNAVVDNHSALVDGADPENRRLRLVDQR